METKTCPNCGEEVPTTASRCKHCFHDFSEKPAVKNKGLLMVVGLLAAMMCLGAAVMYYVLNYQSVKENVVIDEDTKSVVWTRTWADKMETDRLSFDDVVKIEVVLGGKDSTWEVALITRNGERRIINESNDVSLASYAKHISNLMDKPLEEIRKIKGFGEKYSLDD